MKFQKIRQKGFAEGLTESELHLVTDTANEWSHRISKLYYQNERDKATPGQAQSWEVAAEYFNSIVYIGERILRAKRPLKYADLRTILTENNKLRRKIKLYCRALHAFGITEQSEFWPENLLFDSTVRQVPDSVVVKPETPEDRDKASTPQHKQDTDSLEPLSAYQHVISIILQKNGRKTKAAQVAENINIQNRQVFNSLPKDFRDTLDNDDTIDAFSQLIKKYPILRKRFENTVSEVRVILKERNLGKP